MHKLLIPLVLTLLLSWTPSVFAGCPQLPELPVLDTAEQEFAAGWQWFAEPTDAYQLPGGRYHAPLGVARLRVGPDGYAYYDWPRKVVLPLWTKPEGEFLGWLRSGRFIPAAGGETQPFSGAGTVETDYEQQSMIVFESRPDGWLMLRLGPGVDDYAWTHHCHLDHGATKLVVQEWADLLREHADWLIFRDRVPHRLYQGPGSGFPVVAEIGLDHKIELLEIAGDWMRVEVQQPDQTCGNQDQPFHGTLHQGWIRWRDEATGPLVWYYTRGC